MTRLRAVALPSTLLVALGVLVGVSASILDGAAHAELENQVFTSLTDRLRLVVPRGWRATEHPSYPGLLLWMMRSEPPGQIALSSEPFTHELYCKWPISCRSAQTSITEKYACYLREQLGAQKLRVGPVQPGPKENTAAGLPSVWFEYDDGKHFLRQAVAVSEDRAVSLVLSSPTSAARTAHTRAFDQTLRTLRILSDEEAVPAGTPDAAVVVMAAEDGDIVDATTLPLDAVPLDGGVSFESAPAPKVSPIGPCVPTKP